MPGEIVGRGRVLRRRIALFLAIAISGAAIDLLTKEWIFSKLWPPDGRKIWVWEPFVAFELSLNQGALFGMGQGFVWLFALLSVVAAVGILYWLFYRGEARDLWLCIALAMVTGGILGNLYDRLGLHGLVLPDGAGGVARVHAVRDWILLTYQGHNWPNFNVADSLLVCGAGMLLIQVFFKPNPAPEH
jgi:signal peptidase II